jgi:hypothetical protein
VARDVAEADGALVATWSLALGATKRWLNERRMPARRRPSDARCIGSLVASRAAARRVGSDRGTLPAPQSCAGGVPEFSSYYRV